MAAACEALHHPRASLINTLESRQPESLVVGRVPVHPGCGPHVWSSTTTGASQATPQDSLWALGTMSEARGAKGAPRRPRSDGPKAVGPPDTAPHGKRFLASHRTVSGQPSHAHCAQAHSIARSRIRRRGGQSGTTHRHSVPLAPGTDAARTGGPPPGQTHSGRAHHPHHPHQPRPPTPSTNHPSNKGCVRPGEHVGCATNKPGQNYFKDNLQSTCCGEVHAQSPATAAALPPVLPHGANATRATRHSPTAPVAPFSAPLIQHPHLVSHPFNRLLDWPCFEPCRQLCVGGCVQCCSTQFRPWTRVPGPLIGSR